MNKTIVLALFLFTVEVYACGMAEHQGKSDAELYELYSNANTGSSMSEADARLLGDLYLQFNSSSGAAVLGANKLDKKWVMEIGYRSTGKPSGEHLVLDPSSGLLTHDDWSTMSVQQVLSIRLDQLKVSKLLSQRN